MPLQNTDTQPDDSGIQAAVSGMTPPSTGGIDDVVSQTIKQMPSVNEMIDYDTRVQGAKAKAMEKGIDIQKQGIQQLQGMQAPRPPVQQNIKPAPQPQLQDMFQAFQNPAVVLAGLASLATRAPLTAAFKAGAAALDGFHQGNKEAIEQNYKNWKNETDRAIEQNRIELERYQQTWDKYKDDKTKLIAEMQAQASVSKDEVMLAELKQGANPERIFGLYQERLKAMTELQKATAQISEAKAKAEYYKRGSTGTMDDDTLNFYADQVLAGDKSPYQNLGRGIQGAGNITALRQRVMEIARERGVSGADVAQLNAEFTGLQARQRTAGTYGARVDTAAEEVKQFIPQAQDASNALPRGQWVPVNRLVQQFEAGKSDPRYYDFAFANWSLVNAYSRAINPTGVPRVSDKEHALSLLSMATSKEAYQKVLDRLQLEVDAAQRATHTVQHGGGQGTPAAVAPAAAPSNDGWKIEEVQ